MHPESSDECNDGAAESHRVQKEVSGTELPQTEEMESTEVMNDGYVAIAHFAMHIQELWVCSSEVAQLR